VQVPAPFEYDRATSVDQALALLARHGPEARLLAGGHSLLPMMKLRLARPERLIDINDLSELSYIRLAGDELCIGALTRHRDLLESAVVAEHYPIFRDAERVIADPIVRNRGTIGGSVCQADPSEDLSAAFAAVGATFVIRSSSGTRTVPSSGFHLGAYTTAVGPAEMLVEIRVPLRARTGSAYEKVERRAGDWAIAAVGAMVRLADSDDAVIEVGLGLAAVGAEHFRVPEAEAALVGRPLTEDGVEEAARLAATGCHPQTDQRGPAEYKRALVAELVRRAVRRAGARARGEA
jgi:carbon-monoxide dehydrogenase medium subunit